MEYIGLIIATFIAFIVGAVLGYLSSQKEAADLRKKLRDTRIDLDNIRLGYTDGNEDV